MNRGRRPSIFRLGQIHDTGRMVHATGWGLGLCAANCNCHRNPTGQHIAILEDVTNRRLGLVRYGGPCDCCQPWTFDELAAVLRDLADVAALTEAG